MFVAWNLFWAGKRKAQYFCLMRWVGNLACAFGDAGDEAGIWAFRISEGSMKRVLLSLLLVLMHQQAAGYAFLGLLACFVEV